MDADVVTVDVETTGLTDGFKLNEYFAPGISRIEFEMLAVPGLASKAVVAAAADPGVVVVNVVVGMRQADIRPSSVIEGAGFGPGDILLDEFPVIVEVELDAVVGRWGVGERQFRGDRPSRQYYAGQQTQNDEQII